MARRCLHNFSINGAQYSWMQFNDLSFLTDSTSEYNYGNQSGNIDSLGTNIITINQSTSEFTVNIDNTYGGIFNKFVEGSATGFRLYANTYYICWNGIVSSALSSASVYWAVVLDDALGIGWGLARHDDGIIRGIGGNNDAGRAVYLAYSTRYTSNGGGATSVAKVTGKLKDLSSNLSDIIMVSGGGGGGYLIGENAYPGADAGGIAGSNWKSGNQSSGYAFGQGESV